LHWNVSLVPAADTGVGRDYLTKLATFGFGIYGAWQGMSGICLGIKLPKVHFAWRRIISCAIVLREKDGFTRHNFLFPRSEKRGAGTFSFWFGK